MFGLTFNPIKSWSIWGVLTVVVGYMLQPDVLAILPDKVSSVVMALGAILAALGFRNAATMPSVKP